MHWLLQNNLFNEDAYTELLHTLQRFELSYSIHRVIPFVGELADPIEFDTQNVICMGSYSLRHVAKKNGWTPGVFDIEHVDFRVQKEMWGEQMLNHDSKIRSFADAVLQDEQMFIRPIHDSKVFAGQVIDQENFIDWQRKVCVLKEDFGDSLTANTLIQIVPLKKIFLEIRCWVVKGRIVTASIYKEGSRVVYRQVPHDHPLLAYAAECIAEFEPHEAFVLDVCDTSEGFKVVEINTLNSCGFYAANIPKLVMALDEGFNHG